MALTKETFVEATTKNDVKAIEVEGFPEAVHIRLLSIKEADDLKPLLDTDNPSISTLVTIVLMGVSDANGTCLFADTDIDRLKAMPWKTINGLAKVILEFNGMTEKASEELVKN